MRTASTLFRRRGYDGVGLSEILAASGAPKGSFYHHFPGGKAQLGRACMVEAGAQVGAAIDAAFADAPDFAAGIRRFVGAIADWFERAGFAEGCPVAAIAVATTLQSKADAEAAQAVFDDWRRRLLGHAARFGAALEDGDLELLLMLIEGAWIVARIRRSKEPLIRAGEAFLRGRPAPTTVAACDPSPPTPPW